jgi:hypothetical protein
MTSMEYTSIYDNENILMKISFILNFLKKRMKKVNINNVMIEIEMKTINY